MMGPAPTRRRNDPLWVRALLIGTAMAILCVLVVVPVVAVFAGALERGFSTFVANLQEPSTLHSIGLTLVVAPAAVTRFRFPGRTLLVALIDLPFAISPVVAGLMFVLLFGASGYFGPWLQAHGLPVMFTVPGLILATTFV
jgi:sulfate/thiosulfate transport system permease protein